MENIKEEHEWLPGAIYQCPPLPGTFSSSDHESMSSSGSSTSSSFNSDPGSEPAADNETDRSTSPDRSVEGEEETTSPQCKQPTDPTAAKLASQLLAAQHRQNLHGSFQTYGAPQQSIRPPNQSHLPSQVLNTRPPQHIHHRSPSPPENETNLTGYEALASRLSTNTTTGTPALVPIYRKFEHLNHRIILLLQDEVSELEEQLRHLDALDMQARSHYVSPGSNDVHVYPASRRAAARQGGELEWHRADLVNRISWKLSQYNQALTSFNSVTRDLGKPESEDVERYREYLERERPVVQEETRWLETEGDLVVLGGKGTGTDGFDGSGGRGGGGVGRRHLGLQGQGRVERNSICEAKREGKVTIDPAAQCQTIAIALAVAVLLPILTFTVIPGFLGRMTVVVLVSAGTVGALFQMAPINQPGFAGRDLVGKDVIGRELFGKELVGCAMVYGVVMCIIAGVMA